MYVCMYVCMYENTYQNLSNRPAVEKAYKEYKATVQQELRKMKNEWWSNISEEIQSVHDRKDSKTM